VHHGLRVPMRDGVDLIADHYKPATTNPLGTLLVPGPYGRGWPLSLLFARVYASRGYHVVVESVRGTFGSGGEFAPMVRDRRRCRHRRLASRPTVVHRIVRHPGPVLFGLHAVGLLTIRRRK
jgi:predicted alpha/beta hydrolase